MTIYRWGLLIMAIFGYSNEHCQITLFPVILPVHLITIEIRVLLYMIARSFDKGASWFKDQGCMHPIFLSPCHLFYLENDEHRTSDVHISGNKNMVRITKRGWIKQYISATLLKACVNTYNMAINHRAHNVYVCMHGVQCNRVAYSSNTFWKI